MRDMGSITYERDIQNCDFFLQPAMLSLGFSSYQRFPEEIHGGACSGSPSQPTVVLEAIDNRQSKQEFIPKTFNSVQI